MGCYRQRVAEKPRLQVQEEAPPNPPGRPPCRTVPGGGCINVPAQPPGAVLWEKGDTAL